MTKQPTPQLRKLNPGLLQSDADILAQPLVGHRDVELRELMEVIDNVPGTEPGALVTGGHGERKTFVLARAAAEIRSDLRRSKTTPRSNEMTSRDRARRGHTWDAWPCCGAEVDEDDCWGGRPPSRRARCATRAAARAASSASSR